MFTAINVGGISGGDAFLIKTHGKTILIDTGFAFCAEKTIKNIEANNQSKSLNYIFLTHSHYDHVSGIPYIKSRWPNAKIVASEYAHKIFNKPSAMVVIKEMNDEAAKEWGIPDYPEFPTNIEADIIVKDGEVINIGNITFQVLEVPGHTRCSIAFFSKELNLLIGSETFGIPGDDFKYIVPLHLVGHQMTLDSIKKGASFNAKKLLIPHYGVVSGELSRRFFELSLEAVEKAKDIILDAYKTGMNLDEILDMFKSIYYTETIAEVQPEAAFVLNGSYMIPMILRECLGIEIKNNRIYSK